MESNKNGPTRIISMHVLLQQPANEAVFLASEFELGFMNFLKRMVAKQPLIFGARTCVSRSKAGDNVCIKLEETDEAVAYCVVKDNRLGAVMMASSNYPGRIAIKILHEVLETFEKNVNPMVYAGVKKDTELKFPELG